MARYYRNKLPPWCRQWLTVLEGCVLPIAFFQIVRTLLFPTTFDVFILGVLIGLYFAFHLEWI